MIVERLYTIVVTEQDSREASEGLYYSKEEARSAMKERKKQGAYVKAQSVRVKRIK